MDKKEKKQKKSTREELKEKQEQLQKEFVESIHKVKNSIMEWQAMGQEPSEVFILPVVHRPFFPEMVVTIDIPKEGKVYELVKYISQTSVKLLAIVMTRKDKVNLETVSLKDLYPMGVLGRILRVTSSEDCMKVLFNIERRVKIDRKKSLENELGFLFSRASYSSSKNTFQGDREFEKAYTINIITALKELTKLNPLFKNELQQFLDQSDFSSPGKLADFSASLTTAKREDLQKVLEELDIKKRINRSLIILQEEIKISKLQESISRQVDSAISKNQQSFFLKEQLRAVQKELGMNQGGENSDIGKFRKRIKGLKNLSEEISEVMEEELNKFASLDVHSPEYSICRNYIDWLTILPWKNSSKENHNLTRAEKILNQDHYGLKDVKERILEFISIQKLSGKTRGNIICLIGPPGVGKTSVGKSFARALGRKFYRFSVGGMHDEGEIKGHRRTYLGAMPGKILQALKYTRTKNPVILIDEIDKIGNSYRGDPSSALLEVLDPEQNKEFLDHYLDVPFDLSEVLFILTANVLDTIPSALKDRMETIFLSGYILEEKIEIAKKYLIPKYQKKMGLTNRDVSFTKEGLKAVIDHYARESGVRTFEKHLQQILRKIAKKVVVYQESEKELEREERGGYKITSKDLEEYLKKPIFTSDRFYHQTPIGVSTGLAWTSLGGATLYMETISVENEKVEMKLTGQVGEVMKESAQIAWTYLHSLVKKRKKKFFEKSRVHIHIPEGATPKDGPSAGVAITTALFSLLSQQQVHHDLAMTGEITLTGKILPVGGIKEKLMAARRSKIKEVILPRENLRDYDEISEHIKKGIQIHFVAHYEEVLPLAFSTEKKEVK